MYICSIILLFYSVYSMKSVIIFILWAIVGVVVWGKLGYEYVTAQVSSNMTNIIDTVMTDGVGAGGQALFGEYQGQAQVLVEEQKEAIKAEIQQQIKDYLMQQVDEIFK